MLYELQKSQYISNVNKLKSYILKQCLKYSVLLAKCFPQVKNLNYRTLRGLGANNRIREKPNTLPYQAPIREKQYTIHSS